jgi:hypothetical protein
MGIDAPERRYHHEDTKHTEKNLINCEDAEKNFLTAKARRPRRKTLNFLLLRMYLFVVVFFSVLSVPWW